MSNIKKPKYQKELERFNFAFITMENRASELYEAEYGKKSLQGADDLILERFAGYKDIEDIERFQKILRKLKKKNNGNSMTDEEIMKEFDLIHEMDLEMARLEKIVNYLRETLNDFSSERLFNLKRLLKEYDSQKNKNKN